MVVINQNSKKIENSVSKEDSIINIKENNKKVTIKEWNVEFDVPVNVPDLIYEKYEDIEDTKLTYEIIEFSSESLIKADEISIDPIKQYCGAEEGPLGTLTRTKELTEYLSGRDEVKIGDYYYIYLSPQATCSDDEKVRNLQSSQKLSLEKVITKSLRSTIE